MNESKSLNIVKEAIYLEYKGKALYESAVETTKIPDVADLFRMLAGEETRHIEILRDRYTRLKKGRKLSETDLQAERGFAVKAVLVESVVDAVNKAGYEAAVISAALDFEKNAVQYYMRQAKEAPSSAEKKLYSWLADWETGHLHMLAGIDSRIKEKVWADNQFWPLD